MTSPTIKHAWLCGLCTVLSAGACTHHDPVQSQGTSASAQASLLITREAYLEAIDISLGRIRGNSERVWIDGLGAVWLTASDMRLRRAKRGNGSQKCPPEPALWLSQPVMRSAHRIDLHVVERGTGGSLGKVFEFVCANGQCRIKGDYDTNELMVTTCGPGVEFGRRPSRHPLTESSE